MLLSTLRQRLGDATGRLLQFTSRRLQSSNDIGRQGGAGLSGRQAAARKLHTRSTLYYVTAAGVLFAGATYAAVPLYRMFCQVRQPN